MQEQSSSGGKTSYKLYVEVGVVYAPDGVMEPKYLRLSPTGEKYMIDRVYRRQRSASRKAGGCGICYFVIAGRVPLVRGEQISCVRMQGGDMGSEDHLKRSIAPERDWKCCILQMRS